MKIVNILPRQSGKSKAIFNIYRQNINETAIIVPNARYKHELANMYQREGVAVGINVIRRSMVLPRDFETWLVGRRITKILIDEIFHIDSRDFQRFRESVYHVNGGARDPEVDIIAFGTMKEQIPMDTINLIKEHKAIGGQLDDSLYDDLPDLEPHEINALYFSYLTDLDTTIVIGPGKIEYMDNPHYEVESLNMPFR